MDRWKGQRMSDQKHPMQPMVLDRQGRTRFKENMAVKRLLEFYLNSGHSLFEMSEDDRQQIAQLRGLQIKDYCDLPYADPDVVREAIRAEEKLVPRGEAGRTESPESP